MVLFLHFNFFFESKLKSLFFFNRFLSQSLILFFLKEHLMAFRTKTLYFSFLTGPGEAILLAMIFMGLKLTVGFQWAEAWISRTLIPLLQNPRIPISEDNLLLVFSQALFLAILVWVLILALTLPFKNQATRNGILICLLYRHVPSLFFGYADVTTLNIVCEGLFLSIVTTDLVAAKMSERELHPWTVLLAMLAVFSDFLVLVAVAIYNLALFYEISEYMHLPIFSVNINVYVDGVYDLCHIGHYNMFKNAAKMGTRLFVGVLSDESVAKYKRAPVMTMKERIEIVSVQKHVYQVIPDAPFPGIPESFLQQYNIHIVAHGPEYDTPNDIYYAVPRKKGMTRVLPRTEGISTSDLIKRIRTRPDLEVNKQVQEKEKDQKK